MLFKTYAYNFSKTFPCLSHLIMFKSIFLFSFYILIRIKKVVTSICKHVQLVLATCFVAA